MKSKLRLTIVFAAACVLWACSNGDYKESPHYSLLKEYIGKKLALPADSACVLFNRQYGIGALNCDYMVVSYIEPKDCNPCHLKLPYWDAFNTRLDTISRAQASTLLIIRPEVVDSLVEFLEFSNYDYPIVIDSAGTYTAMNNLPENELFRTFLIDRNSTIIGMGNPVYEENIEQWYVSKIAGKSGGDDGSKTVTILNNKTDLGTVKNGATFNLEYLISNNADSVIELESAVSSCDCVEVRATDLEPKAKGTVYVDFAPTDKKGAFHIPVTLRYRGIERPVVLHLYGYVEQ